MQSTESADGKRSSISQSGFHKEQSQSPALQPAEVKMPLNNQLNQDSTCSVPASLGSVKYLQPSQHSHLIDLIGKRCLVSCYFDNHPVVALWDTGAQTSIVNDTWRQQHLPHTIVQPIADLMGGVTLTGLAANNTEIQFKSWIEVSFKLAGEPTSSSELKVPDRRGY